MLGQELILNLWSTTHLCPSSTFLRMWFSDLATKQERASVSLLRFSLTCFSLVVSYKQLQGFLFPSFSDRSCPPGVDQPHLSESNPTKLAELVLANAVKMKCRKFVRAKDIVKGNAKLNLAFVCNLFNNFPALEPAEQEIPNLEETREEKTFRNWMNSMGVRPFVQNLFLDLDDGCVILQLFDLVKYWLLIKHCSF